MKDLNGNTISISSTSGIDNDAALFINAATITSTTQITAISNLVDNLKINNLWDKMKAIYPVIGGTENSHKYNLKDPRNTNDAFRLSFNGGGWTHNASGMTPNGTTSWADTFLTASTSLSIPSGHLSFYSRNQSPFLTTNIEIGASNNFSTNLSSLSVLRDVSLSVFTWGEGNAGNFATFTSTSSQGFFVGSAIAATAAGKNIYRNGVIGTAPSTFNSPAMPTVSFAIGASNDKLNGANSFSSRECSFASIGSGLTASEVSIFNRIVEAYQTSLSRQVVVPTIINRSSIPIRLVGPRELYGSSLITHFDATDYKNYSLSTLTYVPIPQTGSTLVAAAFDTSFTRRRYNTVSNVAFTINITEANNTWIGNPTAGINVFTGSSFDTNKGSLGNGNQFATTAIGLFTPYSGNNNLAPNSAVTLGFYGFLNANNLNHPGFGPQRFQNAIGINNSIFGFSYTGNSGSANNNVAFYGKTGTTVNVQMSNIKNVASYVLKHSMWLFTITGSNYYWYMNGVLFDSGPLGAGIVAPNLFYPFTGSTASTGNYLSIDGGINGNYNPCEFFIASEYTPPEQVKLLNDYFIVKFKNKTNRYT